GLSGCTWRAAPAFVRLSRVAPAMRGAASAGGRGGAAFFAAVRLRGVAFFGAGAGSVVGSGAGLRGQAKPSGTGNESTRIDAAPRSTCQRYPSRNAKNDRNSGASVTTGSKL